MWLDNHYSLEEREKITEIDTKDWNIDLGEEDTEGKFKFENFPNLRSIIFDKRAVESVKRLEFIDLPRLKKIGLNFSFMEIDKNLGVDFVKLIRLPKLETFLANHCFLRDVEIKDCPEITDLQVGNNYFTDLNFLKSLPKLEKLSLRNNKKLAKKDLKIFAPFKNLIYLDVSNCSFGGSLKPLKDLEKLETLVISNTDLSEGLEYLPESCEKLFCNSSYPHQSAKLTEELEKSKCFKEYDEVKNKDPILKETLDTHHRRYYILTKWRADKANNTTASAISLERLFVIRSNLQQFLKKWGSEDKDGQTELSKLKSPEQFNRFKYLTGVEWASTATTMAGGVLTLVDYTTTGGVITLVAPAVGAGVSQLKSALYETKRTKWEEFKIDADGFLDNYNELLGILEQVEVGKWGQVNAVLKNLNNKVKQFLEEYDYDGNGEIDIEELTKSREKFSDELGKVKEIIEAMKELENKVIDYRQGELTGEDEIKVEKEKKISKNSEFKSSQLIINKEQVKADEELEKRVKKEFAEKFPTRKIIFLLRGKGENQILIISRIQDNISEDLLPKWLSRNYALDLYEGEKNTENNNFPQLFSSLEKAVEKAMVVAEIILTDEQKKNIVEKAQQIIDDERKAKEIKVKSSEKEQEKLINALERILLEKEIKKLQKTKNSGEETGKFTLCCLCHLVKNYLSKKETETASNQDLSTSIDEQIQENNQMAQIEVSPSRKN